MLYNRNIKKKGEIKKMTIYAKQRLKETTQTKSNSLLKPKTKAKQFQEL
jgi:hypothetical protein